MKTLIPKTRGTIIYGKICRQSGRTIAKNLGCSKTAVYNTLKRFHQTELKAFVQENSENRRLCAKKLSTVWTSRLKNPISAFTIRHTLKK
ncbi:1369_t:CDS:2, partial [Funneliformis geosporum]